jgi:hypothetical protein
MAYVIIEDPTGKYGVGTFVSSGQARQIAAYNVLTIPVDPSMLHRSGIGGYAMRFYGAKGFPLITSNEGHAHHCPLTLLVCQDTPKVHFAARVKVAKEMGGRLRFTHDRSQPLTLQGGMSQEENPWLHCDKVELEEDGTFLFRGSAMLNTISDNYYEFSLYGQAKGSSVLWFAVSNAKELDT